MVNQTSKRHYLETNTENNKVVDWQHRYTWGKSSNVEPTIASYKCFSE
ncbi:hypothetical protein ACEW7V_00750 [Areca yellow leaf disease phytoplasma]